MFRGKCFFYQMKKFVTILCIDTNLKHKIISAKRSIEQ